MNSIQIWQLLCGLSAALTPLLTVLAVLLVLPVLVSRQLVAQEVRREMKSVDAEYADLCAAERYKRGA